MQAQPSKILTIQSWPAGDRISKALIWHLGTTQIPVTISDLYSCYETWASSLFIRLGSQLRTQFWWQDSWFNLCIKAHSGHLLSTPVLLGVGTMCLFQAHLLQSLIELWVGPGYLQATIPSIFMLGLFWTALWYIRLPCHLMMELCHNDWLPGLWILLCCHGAPEPLLWLLNRISAGRAVGAIIQHPTCIF